MAELGLQESDGDPAFAVVKQLDASDLADVFAVAEVSGRMIGDRDEETHAFLVVPALGEEVETFARNIPRCGDFLEGFAARTGRTELHRLAHCYSAAPAMVLLADVLHKVIRPRPTGKSNNRVSNGTACWQEALVNLNGELFNGEPNETRTCTVCVVAAWNRLCYGFAA